MQPKIILDINSPTRSQTKQAIDRYRKSDRIYLNNSDYQDLKERCPGCGTPFSKIKAKGPYFGQVFCIDNCLSQWLKTKP